MKYQLINLTKEIIDFNVWLKSVCYVDLRQEGKESIFVTKMKALYIDMYIQKVFVSYMLLFSK